MKRAVAPVVTLLIVAGILVWLLTRPDDGPPPGAAPPPSSPAAVPTPSPVAPRACPTTAKRPFEPRTISVTGIAPDTRVIMPPREANDVPGTPPLTSAGKTQFAFDREQGIRPGDKQGNVLLNAHTWPDGSALGNRLLDGLHRGDRIVVQGARTRLCYRVTKRVEVSAAEGLASYYDTSGKPQLAIVVCSGRRLGPGRWENRTVWFASPRA